MVFGIFRMSGSSSKWRMMTVDLEIGDGERLHISE